MALWLEHWTFNRENLNLNSLAAVSKFGQFRSLHVASVHSEYLAMDSGRYVNEVFAE